jgi:hypothetical protein
MGRAIARGVGRGAHKLSGGVLATNLAHKAMRRGWVRAPRKWRAASLWRGKLANDLARRIRAANLAGLAPTTGGALRCIRGLRCRIRRRIRCDVRGRFRVHARIHAGIVVAQGDIIEACGKDDGAAPRREEPCYAPECVPPLH